MRIVRCKIELDMIEGSHFVVRTIDQDTPIVVRAVAERAFLDTVNQLDNDGDLHEYVQSEIIDEND